MQIEKAIKIIDLGLYLKKEKVLILGDFHIGFEEALEKQGTLIPRMQFEKTIKRLEKILKKVKPETIVINGDLKHEFGKISEQEWADSLKLIDFLEKHCKQVVLVKGNHDTILDPIALEKKLKVVESVEFGEVQVIHGHKVPVNLTGRVIIIGHEHPAVTLSDDITQEKFKCFLKGKFQDKTLIVMPSFNLVTIGTDVLREKTISPFLQQDLSDFECWVIAKPNETLYFGKLRNLM